LQREAALLAALGARFKHHCHLPGPVR